MFYYHIWGYSIELMEGEFKTGAHLEEWCRLFQEETLLSILSARKHSKSEIAHAYLAWRIFRMDYKYLEKWLYISYTGDLAGEHLAETKERIAVNEMFDREGIVDLTDAKTILHYQKGTARFYCQPGGIQSFKRGKHPDGVITDDILRDPETKLDMSQIDKITRIFFEQVMSLPKEGGLGVKNIGTAQDEEDLFHQLEKRKQFSCHRYEAIKDYKNKVTLWGEMFSFERLMQIRDDEIGAKAFQKEYMCVPVRSTEGFFNHEDIDQVIYKRLKNRDYYKEVNLNEYAYGGLDIGKKRHPSHISLVGKDRKGRLVQLLSIWMDGRDYNDQLEVCREIIKNFKVQRFFYDDTRAELEGFREVGQVPAQMKGLPFTAKLKHQMAVEFEKAVNSKQIMLIADDRQKRQILNVDNDLKSMETPEGHGDSFWSNAMAIHASRDNGANIRFL